MDQNNEKTMYDYADKFIDLANEMFKSDKSETVGMAIRFAAARYTAFEASMQTNNLTEDKETQLQRYANDFKKMLQFNLEDYIKLLSQE